MSYSEVDCVESGRGPGVRYWAMSGCDVWMANGAGFGWCCLGSWLVCLAVTSVSSE